MDPLSFEVVAADGPARGGVLRVHGQEIPTPIFMPVGTRAAVKGVEPAALEAMGYGLILANTYHLMVRPGAARIGELGGLHRFMGWDRAILTDSGGYQVFSLTGLSKVTEDGARFRSHLDGSRHELTPEGAVRIQETLGSDIVMPLDVCTGLPARRDEIVAAKERTTRWLRRSIQALRDPEAHALFGIVQGGTEPDLRAEHAQELAEFDLPGYSIGGLSVGEPVEELYAMAAHTAGHLPVDKPRYLMGVGNPEDLVACATQGVDMFDCVVPTRHARNGHLFTRFGDVIIKHARYATDDQPLDPTCTCETCSRFSRAYLRHLFLNRDPLSVRLNSIHNLHYYRQLMAGLRQAVMGGQTAEFVKRFHADRAVLGVRKKS